MAEVELALARRRAGARTPAWPLIGSLVPLFNDPLGFFDLAAASQGDVARFRLGPLRAVLLTHPELVREVLLTQQHHFRKSGAGRWVKSFLGEGLFTSDGELHTRQRRLCQPALHRQNVDRYAPLMAAFAQRTAASWHDGQEIDLTSEMMRLTLSVVGQALFGADVEPDAPVIAESLAAILALFYRFTTPITAAYARLPLPRHVAFRRACRRLDAIIYRIIDERRRDGRDRGDLLSTLLAARDADGAMDDRQVRDEVMTLILAGHETSAAALSWAFLLLSHNPEAEARLFAELDGVLDGRPPRLEDVARLPYAQWVFAETLRLYPPLWVYGRRALRDVDLLGRVRLRAGTLALVSPYVTQRDPRFFDDPLAFRPERFAPEAAAARPRFCYFPFSAGARQCLGEPFAWLEAVLVIATLAQRFRLRGDGRTIDPLPLATLRPKQAVRLRVERRAPARA